MLRENDLIELPKELGELTRLRELHVQGNRLTVLPPDLGSPNFSPCTVSCRHVFFFSGVNIHYIVLFYDRALGSRGDEAGVQTRTESVGASHR